MSGIYIKGIGAVTPQYTHDSSRFLEQPETYDQNNLRCVNPNYKEFIAPMELRRMSRIIRMGIASARISMADAGVELPDAIIAGTGMGCVEDTEKFLISMIDNKEQLLTPTSFIRSTHNTVGAQIAVMLKCHNYNFTYVHRGFSFENALQDAMLLIREGDAGNVLAGGIDETSDNHYTISGRLGFWKEHQIRNLDLLKEKSEGTIAGEGSVFTMLSNEKGKKDYGRLMDVETIFQPESNEIILNRITSFLDRSGLKAGDIDLLILGYSGDMRYDHVFDRVRKELFENKPATFFKHLCGEYHTASSFAFWLAARILETQTIPETVKLDDHKYNNIRNVLIYNHFMNHHHTLMLLSK